jgi:signal peptidase II
MLKNKTNRIIFIIVLLVVSIGLDQYTKFWVRLNVPYFNTFTCLHGHVVIEHVDNSGAFLSLGDSLSGPLRYILLNILPLIAILVGLYYVISKADLNKITTISIVLIIAGGLGNLYDRVKVGAVTDFMQVDLFLFKTGIFNLADMYIMAGTIMIILHAWFKKTPEEGIGTATSQE